MASAASWHYISGLQLDAVLNYVHSWLSLLDSGDNDLNTICRSCRYKSNVDLTIPHIMERLPTEIMVEVLGHSDKSIIHSFTTVSLKYCAIAQPLLFRRICIPRMAYKRSVLFVEEMENSSKLALMIKILSIQNKLIVEQDHLWAHCDPTADLPGRDVQSRMDDLHAFGRLAASPTFDLCTERAQLSNN